VEIESLHDFCAERGIRFVSDEVYHPIYHGPMTRSAARLQHATVISDFSKALCLSGLRLCWMIERDPHRREQYLNARNHFTVTSSPLTERIAVLALEHRNEIYTHAARVAGRNLTLLDEVFAQNEDRLRWIRPAGGMTAFPWIEGIADAREFCRRLMSHGVLVVPGDCFGQPAHFRLGFAASGDQFPNALERFARFLRSELHRPAASAAN